MGYLQAHVLVSGDMGGMEIAGSISGVRSRLKIGDMEANIWALLPYSVLTEQILRRLPLISNVRFRCVSRDWNKLLPSYSPPPTRGICFFGSLAKVGDQVRESALKTLSCTEKAQDESNSSSSLKTIRLDFSFLPQGEGLQPCAAGGGLICFIRNRGKKRQAAAFCPKDFLICNPITKKYKQLTGGQKEVLDLDQGEDEFGQVIYELLVDDSNEYKFLVSRVGNSLIKLHSFDSRTSSWTNKMTQEPPHPHCFMHWDWETVPVFQNGQVKVIDVVHVECETEKNYMQSKGLYTALPVSRGSSFRIVGAPDSLFAVEVMVSPNKGLDIWRQDGNAWEKVSSLPPDSAKVLLECFTDRKFRKDDHLHCQMCWFSEDILCLKLSMAQTCRIVTCHLTTKRWKLWHAQFTGVPDLRPCYTMFSFAPSLKQVP